MSAWLSRLVRQSRVAERSVRPTRGTYRAPAFAADASLPPIETEAFVTAPAASASSDSRPPPETRRSPSADAADRARRHALAEARPTRDAQGDVGEEVVAAPRQPVLRHPPRGEGEATSRDMRAPRDAGARAAEGAAQVRAPADAVRVRGESSAAAIRPASPMRVAVPPGAAGLAADGSAAVPDVHIHIGRLELTALTAPPAARRERTTGGHKPMSLDEYLRRRDGGGR